VPHCKYEKKHWLGSMVGTLDWTWYLQAIMSIKSHNMVVFYALGILSQFFRKFYGKRLKYMIIM
jgi:hypothetical protein